MFAAAQRGLLPEKLRKTNQYGVPTPLIMIQGLVVTIWGAILTFGGGGKNLSFLVAISLTVVIYLIGYLLFFLGYFVLLFRKKNLPRSYNVPGGRIGKVLIAGSGLILSLFALVISFVPPASIPHGEQHTYQLILLTSFLVTLLIPFVLYEFHDKSQHSSTTPEHIKTGDVNPATYLHARGEYRIVPNEQDTLKQ